MVKWATRKTLLIVGEGYDEVAFLNHIKQFPGVCGQGVQITIKNARGKGALGVIDWTTKQIANVAYDKVAVLLDTDTDWTPKVAKLAKTGGIQVLTSEPCLEALLLRVLGQIPGESKDLKKQFAPFAKNNATRTENYADNFSRPVLAKARAYEPTIDALLKLFGI
ncbi:MAG: hypothetical protein PHX38_01350 [Sulfuricella sp.]|nr:hypothetical protein [Sulfuricella sp.]